MKRKTRNLRPLIGLNTSQMDMEDAFRAKAICHFKYVDAVAGAGGVPIILPPYTDCSMLAEVLGKLDGFCLIGGPDYDPAHYGGHAQPAAEVMHARRHSFDLALAHLLLDKTPLPVLGICGGCQLLNLARGGALVQDLRTEWRLGGPQSLTLPHSGPERKGTSQEDNVFRHEVRLAAGSRIRRILGAATVMSNSFHHQAVQPQRLGRGLEATAWSTADEVIEAVELAEAGRFVLGVQWHPERQTDEPQQRAIFEALVRAAVSSPAGGRGLAG
ncbi:MAG: gamma-glutamyl-gamma-aminobutyrate hydrolase family protein [Planctomycetota bacterium]